ncbi:MAG TPA: right-handed parallel beta-helix repeat-containing protein [Polyangiaceae bacterium]|nr:right-handed parallel beta-helix repeat-containing protein [Polyangiaceae bacterium]
MAGYVASAEERLIGTVAANPAAHRAWPVDTTLATGVKLQPFGPFEDPATGAWDYARGWRLAYDDGSPAMVAVASGVIHFSPASARIPASIGLSVAGNGWPAMVAAGFPEWLPAPDWIVYSDVDPTAVRDAVQALLEGDANRLAALQKGWAAAGKAGTPTARELADALIAGPAEEAVSGGVPVLPGDVIGHGALDAGVRRFELQLGDTWLGCDLTANPAYYYAYWSELELIDLSGHAFETESLRIEHAPLTNGVMRFVSQAIGSDASTDFTDPTIPAATVTAAVRACGPGDTVVILDTATYRETDATADAKWSLRIDAGVHITSAAELPAGAQHLGTSGSTGYDDGVPIADFDFPVLSGPEDYSGIRDDMADDDSRMPTQAGRRVLHFELSDPSAVASVTKVVITNGGAREGGGIQIAEESKVVVASCRIHRNIGYFDINPTSRPTSGVFSGSGWFEEGSGGGIGILRASPLIWGNRIERNLAMYGGAIGIFAWCFPTIRNNLIHGNAGPDWSSLATIADGGAIRVLQQSLAFSSIGQLNKVVKPGGPFGVPKALVEVPVEVMYDDARLEQAKTGWIRLIANKIQENRAADDGGGVYATAVARIFAMDNEVTNNTAARGDGGGYRISTASTLRAIRETISGNRVDGARGDSPTGGGVAVRCSNLYVTMSTISDNRNAEFAGGGVAFTATREGDVSTGMSAEWQGYTLPTWDEQRRDGLDFDSTELQIDASTSIHGNEAPGTTSGKGGGIYVFRFKDDGSDPFTGDTVELVIEDARYVLDDTNTSGFEDGGDTPYDRIYLLDQTKTSPSSPTIIGDAELDDLSVVLFDLKYSSQGT